jgi:SAM-dependent methyltransferase
VALGSSAKRKRKTVSGSDAIGWYEANAASVVSEYERLPFETVHAWFLDSIPEQPGSVLDVGAGSGRDAAALAMRGFEVVAVEPSAAMTNEGQRRHTDARIRWVRDRLPGLDATFRLGLSFDFILLSAVWMHLPSQDRPRAFRKLISLLKPGGFLAITFRERPASPERGMHPASMAEVERLARAHGAFVERAVEDKDQLERADVRWTQLIIRLPDDGTGALPLLRYIILNDAKSSTYKLALLRAVARTADGACGMAHHADDDYVRLPLGIVALYWLRLFKPLIQADLPQTPTNRGTEGLGFTGAGFRALGSVSHLDLRVGARFTGDIAPALHQALREACETITRMPAFYMTYPGGGQIMKARRLPGVPRPEVTLDEAYLSTFGELLIPTNIWRALIRFDAWIEPALIAEWLRLMKLYGERRGRQLNDAAIIQAMAWSEPTRDVAVARQRALDLIDGGGKLFCVWSGQLLTETALDIDHCLPWAAWPCDDLWNLLPAHRKVNQREKRKSAAIGGTTARCAGVDRGLVAGCLCRGVENTSQRSILRRGASQPAEPHHSSGAPANRRRVRRSALKRLALKQDQQVPEWA